MRSLLFFSLLSYLLYAMAEGGTVGFSRFELVVASTNTTVRPLVNGTVIKNNGDWNIFALPIDASAIASAEFFVGGVSYKKEYNMPYAMCGDFLDDRGVLPCNLTDFPDGTYEMTVLPYVAEDFVDPEANGLGKLSFILKTDNTLPANRIVSVSLKDEINGDEQTIAENSVFEYKPNTVLNTYMTFESPVGSVWFSYDINGVTKVVTKNSAYNEQGYKATKVFSLCEPSAGSCLPVSKDGEISITVYAFSELENSGYAYPKETISFKVKAEPLNKIVRWVLVDAFNDTDVRVLNNGDTFDRSEFPEGAFNARAVTDPEKVGSVQMKIDGKNTALENNPPYAICSDNNFDYVPCYFPDGQHTFSAIAYSERAGNGTVLDQSDIIVTITTSKQVNGVFSFTLLDGNLENPIELSNEGADNAYRSLDVVNYAQTGYSLQVNVVPANIRSVRYYVNDVEFGVDNSPPFTMCGKDEDFESGFLACNFQVGEVVKVSAVAYSSGNGNGYALPGRDTYISVIDSSNSKGVTTISLFDIQKNADIKTLVSGSFINLADIPSTGYTIVANADPAEVKSVQFYVDGSLVFTDSVSPFTLCKEVDGKSQPCAFETGKNYKIRVVPFTDVDGKGVELDSKTIELYIDNLSLGNFYVIDMNTGEKKETLVDGFQLDKAKFEDGSFNIGIENVPADIGGVSFSINGEVVNTLSAEPYLACSEQSVSSVDGSSITRCYLNEQTQTIRATGYLKARNMGEPFADKSVTFSVTSTSETPIEGVKGFQVVSSNGTVLSDVASGQPIETTNEGFSSINFVPVVAPAVVGSVGVKINNTFSHYSNSPPYTVCADNQGLPSLCNFEPGEALIECTPYTQMNGQGKSLPSLSLTVLIVSQTSFSGIKSVALINSLTNTIIGIVTGSATLNPGEHNILVSTSDDVKSVEFIIDNSRVRVDNMSPFTLCPGVSNSKYEECIDNLKLLSSGRHTLSVRAYSGQGGTGALVDSNSQDLILKAEDDTGSEEPTDSDGGGGLGVGAIIGIAVGAAVLLILLLVLILFRRSKSRSGTSKKGGKDLEKDNPPSQYEDIRSTSHIRKPSSKYDPSDPEWIRYYACLSGNTSPTSDHKGYKPSPTGLASGNKCSKYYHPSSGTSDVADGGGSTIYDDSYLTASDLPETVDPTSSSFRAESEHTYSNYDNVPVSNAASKDEAGGAEEIQLEDTTYDDPNLLCSAGNE